MKDCGLINLTFNNPTSESQLVKILDVLNPDGGATTYTSAGKIFNTTEGSGNGSQLPTVNLLKDYYYDNTNNILYVATSSGIWVYDINTDTGSIINTSTGVTGDNLPNNDIVAIAKDITNNVLYAGSQISPGVIVLWKYDMDAGSGLIYNATGGVSGGDNLTSNTLRGITLNGDDTLVYVSGPTFIWSLTISTNVGSDISPATGDPVPSGLGNNGKIYYDSQNNFLWVGLLESGLYRYDISLSDGKLYTTVTGVGSGEQLPSDANYRPTQKNNIIYVPTGRGIWVYDIGTDTGSIIDDSASVNGDPLPSPSTSIVKSVFYDAENDKLWAGIRNTKYQIWSYDFATNTGAIIDSADSGDVLPSLPASVGIVLYADGSLYNIIREGGGIWKYTVSSVSAIIITGNDGNSISDYSEIVNSVKTNPLEINRIVFKSNNAAQIANILTAKLRTITGYEEQYTINFSDYVDPLLPYHTVHIDLPEPILIDINNFMQMSINANTYVNFIFEFCQVNYNAMLDNDWINKGFIGPPISGGFGDEGIVPIQASIVSSKKCGWLCWIIIIAGGYLLYKYYKK
jgi:hypothetical protein